MIEILLQAERALTAGAFDQAERLYTQAIEVDPRNAIALVGLARVTLARAEAQALEHVRRALALDPENAAALRLEARLGESPHTAPPAPIRAPEAPGIAEAAHTGPPRFATILEARDEPTETATERPAERPAEERAVLESSTMTKPAPIVATGSAPAARQAALLRRLSGAR